MYTTHLLDLHEMSYLRDHLFKPICVEVKKQCRHVEHLEDQLAEARQHLDVLVSEMRETGGLDG